MNPHLLISPLLFLSLLTPPTTSLPHFFPNISSIPPSLIPNTSFGAWDTFKNLINHATTNKTTGLSKLKNYLHHFGYLNKTSTNFTDDFDETLHSAIRTYQTNFNLNATGILDQNTLNQILIPRCGNADIINGTSSMGSTSNTFKSPSPIHLHTVQHYSFFPRSPRWPLTKTDLTYSYLPDNQISNTVKSVFSHAFERWTEVTPLTFTETSSFSTADIKIGFFAGDHGDGEPFDGAFGILAHAFSPPSGMLHFDGDEDWVIDGSILNSPAVMSGVDLESVAVHEIGHLLGLGHSSVEESIMYPSISSGMRKVELANDDILGIQVLYGSYNDSLPPMTTVQPSDFSGAGYSFFGKAFVLVVALVFLAL